jgi:hypothetical protein
LLEANFMRSFGKKLSMVYFEYRKIMIETNKMMKRCLRNWTFSHRLRGKIGNLLAAKIIASPDKYQRNLLKK